jgi:NTP pyrophosphatase (non-canonical NTP hydrolase)
MDMGSTEIAEGLVTQSTEKICRSTGDCQRDTPGMEYGLMVATLKKSPELILGQLTPIQTDAIHMTIGLAGEAGEMLDAVKKWTIYQKELDLANVKEELGDLEFYLEGLRQIFGFTREEILEHNQEKLLTGKNARYKEGYSDKAAIARADKEAAQ